MIFPCRYSAVSEMRNRRRRHLQICPTFFFLRRETRTIILRARARELACNAGARRANNLRAKSKLSASGKRVDRCLSWRFVDAGLLAVFLAVPRVLNALVEISQRARERAVDIIVFPCVQLWRTDARRSACIGFHDRTATFAPVIYIVCAAICYNRHYYILQGVRENFVLIIK